MSSTRSVWCSREMDGGCRLMLAGAVERLERQLADASESSKGAQAPQTPLERTVRVDEGGYVSLQ